MREIDHGERCSGDAKNVGSEVGDLLFDVDVRALHDGHHGDQRGDTHGQAEHGQRRTKLVGADGVDGQPQIVANTTTWAGSPIRTQDDPVPDVPMRSAGHGKNKSPAFRFHWSDLLGFIGVRRHRRPTAKTPL